MKIYILSSGERDDNTIEGVYDSWRVAYEHAKLNRAYAIEPWNLNSDTTYGWFWIVTRKMQPYRIEFNPAYSRYIDPTDTKAKGESHEQHP
jgi:hypothetical protein